jgi:hypothetical protein
MTKKETQFGQEFQIKAKAAEYAVASKLLLLGHNGIRLQVKCSHLRVHSKNFQFPGYLFNLQRGAWDSLSKRYRKTAIRPYSEVADFFVLWGIDENRFFILPAKGAGQTVWFTHRGYESKSQNKRYAQKMTEGRLRDMEDRWDLLDINGTSSELIESSVPKKVAVKKQEDKALVFEFGE